MLPAGTREIEEEKSNSSSSWLMHLFHLCTHVCLKHPEGLDLNDVVNGQDYQDIQSRQFWLRMLSQILPLYSVKKPKLDQLDWQGIALFCLCIDSMYWQKLKTEEYTCKNFEHEVSLTTSIYCKTDMMGLEVSEICVNKQGCIPVCLQSRGPFCIDTYWTSW